MATKATTQTYTQTIDGFVKAPSVVALATRSSKEAAKGAAQEFHRGAQRSQTLMRTVVKKPAALKDSKISHHLRRSQPQETVHAARADRAQKVARNPHINRFNAAAAKKQHEDESKDKNETTVIQSAPVKVMNSKARPLPSLVTSASHQQLERMLDHALARADAHKKALGSQKTGQRGILSFWRLPRWLTVFSGAVLVIGILSYLAWNNIPQVSVRLAALRSNFSATVPAYNPSGFGFAGPASINDKTVSMKYRYQQNAAQQYTISQQASEWDSSSLLANFVTPADKQYQTSQVKGNTVYIYGNGDNATWVNNGIWYNITDQAGLDSDQLLKIAESL